jgi:hypothetical protein
MPPPAGFDIKLDFNLIEHEASYIVQLTAQGESAEARFKHELLLDGTEAGKALAAVQANRAEYPAIRYLGTELLHAVTGGNIKALYDKVTAARKPGDRFLIRLSLPAGLRELPWESLYDGDIGPLAGDPKNYSILRRALSRTPIPDVAAQPGVPVSMLCVIPSGSRLDTDSELTNIRHAGKQLNPGLEVEPMLDYVEPDQLHDALNRRHWDIVHYVGHGKVVGEGADPEVQIRLHNSNGQDLWMDAESFAQLFANTGVRLVVLNCCSLETPSPTRYLSGVSPYLIRKGIPAVVAMRYEIADTLAIRFSNSLYQNLFGVTTPGRIDVAVESARGNLFQNKQKGTERSFITPVVYVADGYEQLFTLQTQPPSALSASLGSLSPAFQLPDALVTAFKQGDCVPVIGPGILRLGLIRRGSPTTEAEPGPRELAETLAAERPYEGFTEDHQFGLYGGESMSAWLLHLVCQVYHDVDGRNRGNLLKSVLAAFKGLEPNDTIRALVKWNVPALFYTYFDGLLEQCFNEGTSPLNALVSSVTAPPVGDPISIPKQRPLVLLRGSLSDPDSLVLTEEDYETLLDSVARMNRWLAAITRRIGRSILFLGVSPRDVLVRALARQLIETGDKRKQGPIFFVAPRRTCADEAYWRRYGIQWIDASSDEVINALNSV